MDRPRKCLAPVASRASQPKDYYVDEANLHLEAAKECLKDAEKRVSELAVYELFTPEERRKELCDANKVVRAAKVQLESVDWSCTFFSALRTYDERMFRYRGPGCEKLNETMEFLKSIPHESELWSNTYSLVLALESVCAAKVRLDEAVDVKKKTSCRRSISVAVKAALREVFSFKTAATMMKAAEKREFVHKNAAASLKRELDNWKQTVDIHCRRIDELQEQLKLAKEEVLEAKRSRTFVFVD